MITLKVDSRETRIIELLKETDLNYTTENLNIGDFIFYDDENPICIIERKTLDDLTSSIIDNRFREQKSRIAESNIPTTIYIIESTKGIVKTRLPEKNLVGSVVNLIINHNFHVLQTNSLKQTVDVLLDIFKKLSEKQNNPTNSVFKYSKRSDSIEQDLFSHQLSLIPRLSLNLAQEITKLYPSYKILYEIYSKLEIEKEKEELLKDITLNNRKLGKILSLRIYEKMYK